MSAAKRFDMTKLDLNDPNAQQITRKAMNQSAVAVASSVRPAEYETVWTERISIPMPDGVRLSAFLTMPEKRGRYPVILVRNPYVSNSFVYEGILPVFARYGYAALLVEVRGSQTSEGEWLPFENEMKDGRAVLDWIAAQEWCDGAVGTFGGSYLGHTQWAVANSAHPVLKSLFIQVYGPEPYDSFWRRGMFRQDIYSVWVTQMMGNHRFLPAVPHEALRDSMRFRPQNQIGEHFIGEHVSWYENWITNSRPTDAYWTGGYWGDFYKTAEEICVPLLLEAGWNDIFLRPQMKAWRRIPEEMKQKSRFLIGPWNHYGRSNGDMNYPDSRDDFLFVRTGLEWFDYTLKGMAYPHRLGVVDAYCIRGDKYRCFKGDIAEPQEKKFYLAGDGMLRAECGEAGSICYRYDPEDCPENAWGNVLGDGTDPTFGGPRRQRPVGSRKDELYFVSDVIQEDFEIAGAVQAELYVSSDAEATAFAVTVSEITENGETFNIRDDITDIRFADEDSYEDYLPGSVRKLTFRMADILWKIHAGSRLRVDVASSNHPAYHIHPNTTECWAAVVTSKAVEQTVHYGAGQASCVILPVYSPDHKDS